MDELDDILLSNILRIDQVGKILQKEDDRIEYKESFDNSSKDAKAKYAKEMAALHNYEGGYLIFGVNDTSLELVGLNNFLDLDNAQLVNDISAYFSPSIRFKSKLYTSTNGKNAFVIYVEKRKSIPTVCIKGHPNVLTEAVIYWRYSAQSAPIRAGDLINLLKGLQGEESKRLAEIAEKDFKSKFRPRLWLNGESKSGGEVKIRIENRGEIAYVDGFEIIEKNVDQLYPPNWKNYPIEKERGVQMRIDGGNTHWQQLTFKIAMTYHDAEEHKYQEIIEFKNGGAKIVETKAL